MATPIRRLAFDKDGFYPAHPCRHCGAMLRGLGSGYPAETYAGTYNGLCYTCTSAGPFEAEGHEPSGGVLLSYPPSCPSHRRDRRLFWSYPDCPVCSGTGVVSARGDASPFSSPIPAQCDACIRRRFPRALTPRWSPQWRELSAQERKLAKEAAGGGAPFAWDDPPVEPSWCDVSRLYYPWADERAGS